MCLSVCLSVCSLFLTLGHCFERICTKFSMWHPYTYRWWWGVSERRSSPRPRAHLAEELETSGRHAQRIERRRRDGAALVISYFHTVHIFRRAWLSFAWICIDRIADQWWRHTNCRLRLTWGVNRTYAVTIIIIIINRLCSRVVPPSLVQPWLYSGVIWCGWMDEGTLKCI